MQYRKVHQHCEAACEIRRAILGAAAEDLHVSMSLTEAANSAPSTPDPDRPVTASLVSGGPGALAQGARRSLDAAEKPKAFDARAIQSALKGGVSAPAASPPTKGASYSRPTKIALGLS